MDDLINLNNVKKEKILREISENIEEMELDIKITELNKKIVFISAVKEKFKGKILFSFLEMIYGEKYKDETWEILEEYENKNYIEINKFFDLLEKAEEAKDIEEIHENNNAILEISDEEEVTKSNEEQLKVESTNDIKYLEKNPDLIPEIPEQTLFLSNVTENIPEAEKPENEKTQELSSEKNPEETEKKKSLEFDKTKIYRYEKFKAENQIKEAEILKLISETITLIEEKRFRKAVQNVGMLAKIDKSDVLNNEKIRYSLEGVLLRVIRFFIPRNLKNREYWSYFIGRYGEKLEFYENIVSLRGYCGLELWYKNEEYEVNRKDWVYRGRKLSYTGSYIYTLTIKNIKKITEILSGEIRIL